MPPTLADTMTDMLVYFAVLLATMAVTAPLVILYKRKHGRLNEKAITVVIVGTAVLAAVITLPILLVVKSNQADDAKTQQLAADMAKGLEAQKQRQQAAQEALARSMTVNERGQVVLDRSARERKEPTPEERAEIEAEQQALHQAIQEKNARERERRKQADTLASDIIKAGVYEPAPGASSAMQAQDERIATALAEYQRIVADELAYKQELDNLRAQRNAINQEKPFDEDKYKQANDAFIKHFHGQGKFNGLKFRKKNAIRDLLADRLGMQE